MIFIFGMNLALYVIYVPYNLNKINKNICILHHPMLLYFFYNTCQHSINDAVPALALNTISNHSCAYVICVLNPYPYCALVLIENVECRTLLYFAKFEVTKTAKILHHCDEYVLYEKSHININYQNKIQNFCNCLNNWSARARHFCFCNFILGAS
jgi:hypothetical protein